MDTVAGSLAFFADLLPPVGSSLLLLPWPVAVALVCAPIALALSSREIMAVAGSTALAMLSAASFVDAAPDGTVTTATGLYLGAVLFGLNGHLQRRRDRASLLLSAKVNELQSELSGFLDALDARVRTIDRLLIDSSKAETFEHDDHSRGPQGRSGRSPYSDAVARALEADAGVVARTTSRVGPSTPVEPAAAGSD